MKKTCLVSTILLSLSSSAISQGLLSSVVSEKLDETEFVHFDPHMKVENGMAMVPFMQAVLSLNEECINFNGVDYMDQLCKKVGEIVNDENDMAFPAFYGVDDLKRLPADLSLSQVRTLEKWGASIQAVFEQHVLNRADCPDDNVCIQPVDNGKIYRFPITPV